MRSPRTPRDAAALAAILERLGYTVIAEIDRDVAQYAFDDAVVRFERYPRMDALVEVEGPPGAIERAIEALGMPRAGFSADGCRRSSRGSRRARALAPPSATASSRTAIAAETTDG